MESPPSSSSWSQAFILSDDSGLLLTNGSTCSSFESRSCRKHFNFEDSDCEERSLSQYDSLDGMSDIMCGENFNTLKKGPHWTEVRQSNYPIEPPPEFQDKPKFLSIDIFYDTLAGEILRKAFVDIRENELRKIRLLNQLSHRHLHPFHSRPYLPPDFPFSPCHNPVRPSSRSSLGSSRLSSSHNSLSVPAAYRVDDSTFITQAVSHDTLSTNRISDLYNVPFDSDMYAVPVDVVKPPLKPRRGQQQQQKRRRRNTSSECRELEAKQYRYSSRKNTLNTDRSHWCFQNDTKRHSVAGTSAHIQGEPIHMTLHEVRQYLQTLYSSSSESEAKEMPAFKPRILVTNNNKYSSNNNHHHNNNNKGISASNTKKNTFLINIKNKKVKDSCDYSGNPGGKQLTISPAKKDEKHRKRASTKLSNFKQTLCNIFRFKRFLAVDKENAIIAEKITYDGSSDAQTNISSRALPPLPQKEAEGGVTETIDENILDFATSIQRVKDYGWYWGPVSSEAAEKILSNEPDGSFIVRDSSDDHYIFSLTFKLNNCVRHVRIDHDQGNFSFGSCTKFKSQTIVEFIENAVEHSRSGRYLFFLHRRPVIGPVRVQLLHPVSRFKQIQSLQHMCRFVIHKNVRRDLIPHLPLPRRMIDYVNTAHYYSEHFIDLEEEEEDGEEVDPSSSPASIEELNVHPGVPVNNYIVLNNNDADRQS